MPTSNHSVIVFFFLASKYFSVYFLKIKGILLSNHHINVSKIRKLTLRKNCYWTQRLYPDATWINMLSSENFSGSKITVAFQLSFLSSLLCISLLSSFVVLLHIDILKRQGQLLCRMSHDLGSSDILLDSVYAWVSGIPQK